MELAERAGDEAILVESLGTLCHYETYLGRITPGLIERAVELERAVVRPSNNYSPREILGLRLMYADRLDEGRELLEASLAAATELGDELDRMSLLGSSHAARVPRRESRAGAGARARGGSGRGAARRVGAPRRGLRRRACGRSRRARRRGAGRRGARRVVRGRDAGSSTS